MKKEMLEIVGREINRIPKAYGLNIKDLLELHEIADVEQVSAFNAAFVYGFVMGARANKNGSYKEKRGKAEPFSVKAKREEKRIEDAREKADPPKRPEKIKDPSYMICVGDKRKPEDVETWAYEDGETAIYIETQDIRKVEELIKKGRSALKCKIASGAFDRVRENG